jgi:NAD(P)H-dependent FMN reductase
MRILAVSGSLRPDSANTALLQAMAALAPEDVSVDLFGGLDDLPHFSPDRDVEPAPAGVQAWREALKASDAVLLCTPEYAHGMPGVLKNALDWVVGSGELVDKPVCALAASPSTSGGAFAHAQMMEVLGVMNTTLLREASFTIPYARNKVRDRQVTDPELETRLRAALRSLAAAVKG